MFIPSRFVYLVAGLCGLYLSVVAPLFSSFHSPITWFRVGLWIGTAFLLISAVFPSSQTTNSAALIGSTMTTILLCYEIVRLVELKLGLLHGVAPGVEFQPTMFDRINRILSRPLLLLFLLSSLAALLISALITLRSRNRLPLHGAS